MVSCKIIYSAIIVFFTFYPLLTTGQIEVYRSYEHFRDTNNKEIYKNIKQADFTNNFILRGFQGIKHKIPCDSIWGYTDEKNIL